MEFPFLGFGVGLRTTHYSSILEHWPKIDWFEVISENYMVDGGRPLFVLRQVAEHYPIVMHGVSLSIGSTDPLSGEYLKRLKKLAKEIKPAWISDHLCWGCTGGHNSHDLLPLPYTEEAVMHVARRIREVQEFLETQMLFENISSYMQYTHSTMSEWEFVTAITQEANCMTLLDINNIYVSAINHSFDPMTYVKNVPRDRVKQFHLAGHTDCGTHLLDTHDQLIKPEVWDLYVKAIEYFGPVSTLIEWDDHIPPFEEVKACADYAKVLYEQTPIARRNAKTRLEAHHSA